MSDSPLNLSQLGDRLATAAAALGDPPRAGDLVMKMGRVSRPEWNIRTSPRPDQAAFMKLKLNDVVLVERAMKGRPTDPQSWLHVFARPGNGDSVVEGWVNSAGVLVGPPHPEAKVEYIASGDKLINLAARHYKSGAFKWGDDARFYVAALAYVNRDYSGLTFPAGWKDSDFLALGRWADIGIKSDHSIWVPDSTYLQPLKGQFVTSGSLTYELWQTIQAAGAAAWEATVGLVGFGAGLLHGAMVAIYDALADIVDLAVMVWKVLKSIFTLELLNDVKALWDALRSTDWKAVVKGIVDDFVAKWNADSTWDRWYFRGYVVGYVIGTAALWVFSAGLLAATGALSKLGKLGRAIKAIVNNPAVKAVLENPTVKKVLDKSAAAISKSAEIQQKLASSVKLSDRLLAKGIRLATGYDGRMGIPEEHLKAMIDAAKETNVIAIFRANKKAAIPLIKQGAHGKPMWAKFKTDPNTGVLTASNKIDAKTGLSEIDLAYSKGHFVMKADGKAYKVVGGNTEVMEVKRPFWTVKEGQVLAPDGKPIVGDYDLLGVSPVSSPGSNVSLVPRDTEYGDWNGPWVKKYADAVNKPGRLDEPRVLHGAQDAYGGNPSYMGLTDDTAYAVFPDGSTVVLEGRQAQQAFYDALGRQTAAGAYSNPAPGPGHVDEVAKMRNKKLGL
jgi:hypothetical protein